MKCPQCNSTDLLVIDSRWNERDNYRRRRAECNNCGRRVSTVEIYTSDYRKLVKDSETLNQLGEIVRGLV